jgi:hypothetical protein
MAESFKFPHEREEEKPDDIQVEIEGDPEIEIVDDTPEPDRNRAPMKEPPAEVTDEELEQYSEGVKKRIQHFSKGYHEERRAKEAALREREEALKVTQALLEENKRLQGTVGQGQQVMVEQAKKVAQTELDEAKRKLKEAHEAFDTDAIIEAQEALTTAKMRLERVNSFKPPVQAPQNAVQPQPQQAQPQQPPPQVDDRTRAWLEANPWFNKNKQMTAVAMAMHYELTEDEGVDPGDPQYFRRIDSRVRELFPGAFSPEKQRKTSVVAPASRSTAPKKIVLTQSALAIAKRLGLTPEQYARQVALDMRNQNG